MSEHSEQANESDGLLPLERRTYLMSLATGATATGGAAGAATASSDAQDAPAPEDEPSYEDTWVGYGRGEYGSGVYGDVAPPPFPDSDTQPTDVDGDGLYRDFDGDGDFDIFDVQAFFNNFDSEYTQRYAPFFDYDQSGEVDIFDVQQLFNDLP